MADTTEWEVIEIARRLSDREQCVLLQLREDGKGNYDPALTRARNSLHRKGLADSPMALGFGGGLIACVQHPTELGIKVQRYIGSATHG
ncbi:hypothetical protein [Sphingomonas koreensis]|uniref:hypothetical protein n=1 Tax=Sphingomonas koreensis TaxID=93064 RepID=UPI000F7D9AF1|nr:hypothetical protein [Sphingomonas koreensis]MDC7808822.1 hypothetical protein [Sphingomonas koreensis]RSU98961.1 hypothetical protein CA256_03255 [Sphingomonas koreensis]